SHDTDSHLAHSHSSSFVPAQPIPAPPRARGGHGPHRIHRSRLVTRIALLFTLLLAACMPDESQRTFGGPDGAMPGAADEPLATARPEMPGQEAQADTSWTRDAVSVDRNVYSVLLDVRTASHDGFDRIVMSFGPSAVPGYRVEYVRPPVTQCRSGEEVD